MADSTQGNTQPYSAVHRDRHLGVFSSHPHWLARGSDLLRRFLVASVVLLYLLIHYLWLRGQGIDRMIPAFGSWLLTDAGRFGAGLVAFSLGVMATASFQLRMAMRKQAADLQIGRDEPISFSPSMAALIGLAGFGLPLLLTFLPGLPFEARFFGALIALTPAATLSFLLPSPNPKPVMLPWFSGGLMLPVLLVGSCSSEASQWLQNHLPEGILAYLPVLQTLDGIRHCAMSLCSMFAVIFAFNLLAWIRGLPEKRRQLEQQRAEGQPKASWWRRLLRAIGLGGVVSSDEELAQQKADQLHRENVLWALQLARQCGFEPKDPETCTQETHELSRPAEEPQFDILFGGCRPTMDQFKALTCFAEMRLRCVEDPEGKVPGTGFEMILEGPPGSGRSSVLDAMALLTMLARGTGSVILVADAGRVRFATQRLRERLVALHLDPYVTVGGIEEAWNRVAGGESPADICVTTPELWERWLPGQPVREGQEHDRVRVLMSHYSTVLVDDWLEHPVEIRAHLPFMLDKQRLFLESEMLPRACVVCFPSLTETGRNLAVSRLMGDSGVVDESRQILRLRHRHLPAATLIDVVCDGIDAAVEKLAAALGQSGQPSILLRRGIDLEEAERQTLDYQSKFQGSKITVCYCGDQVQTVDGVVRAVLMKAAVGPEAVFALRAHRSEDAIVMIRVRDRRDIAAAEKITPLIVDRTGRGMAESHLRNILRFILPKSPVHRRCWGQMGLEIPGAPSELPLARPAGSLLLDLPEMLPESERRSRPYVARLGSYLSLAHQFNYLERVDCHWIPDPGPTPTTSAAQDGDTVSVLHLPAAEESAEHSRGSTVLWVGNEGSELGRSQLHYAESLLLRRQRVFCPDRIREETSRGLEIEAAKFRDNGCDAIHPKVEIRWCGEEFGNAPLVVATGHGGPAHRFIWAELVSGSGVQVTSRLIERVDDLDRPSPCFAFKYEWSARVRPLLLGPTAAVIDKQEDYLTQLKIFFSESREWGTDHPGFLPGLTYAFTRGLEADLPSSSFFGKILAFRLQGPLAEFAKAVVWFVEPLGTGRTLSNAVHELLKEEGYLARLSGRMDEILCQGWEKSPGAELARFWLPRRHRGAVTLAERKLVSELRGVGLPQQPKPALSSKWQVTCPCCQSQLAWSLFDGGALQTLSHCGRVISVLVATVERQFKPPAALIEAWWPQGVALPTGTLMQKARRVWALVAERVDYKFDHLQVEGLDDLWLPAAQTWERGVGDCEDHSILIVSMLLHLGIESWLVWGSTNEGGHAWVELEVEGVNRLLEATRKHPLPEEIPSLEQAPEAYGTRYLCAEEIPSRTNGKVYRSLSNAVWSQIDLASALPVSGAVEPTSVVP